MAQTLMTILIKVEPPAFGPVLLKLKEMPGVAQITFDASDSKATKNADPVAPRPAKGAIEQVAIALLMKGPAHSSDLRRALVAAGHTGTKVQAYGVVHTLKKKGLIKSVADKPGFSELTAKAAKSIGDHARPAKASKANGSRPPGQKREPPGTGQKVLLAALANGPLKKAEIAARLAAHHLSEKSLSGVLARAKTAGLIKTVDVGTFDLTAKGSKSSEVAHG